EGLHGLPVFHAFPTLAQHRALSPLRGDEIRLAGVARQELLSHAQLRVRVRGDLVSEVDCRVEQRFGRDQTIREAPRCRLDGTVYATREAHLAGFAEADSRRQ